MVKSYLMEQKILAVVERIYEILKNRGLTLLVEKEKES